jgi:hypothetical protein
MSFNPVEIELRKPSSFGHNKALARLLGDTYNPNRFSSSLSYQSGVDGGGGVPINPDVTGQSAIWNPIENQAELHWDDMQSAGSFEQYELSSFTSGNYVNEKVDNTTTFLNIPLNMDDYDGDSIIWTFKTITEGSGFSGDVFGTMYWVTAPDNFVAEYNDGDGEYVNLFWSHPFQASVNQWRITESTFGLDFPVDGAETGYGLVVDPAWKGTTMYFAIFCTYIDAAYDGLTSPTYYTNAVDVPAL